MSTQRILIASCMLLPLAGACARPDAAPARLRCEYLNNPLAVDTTHPRLSWTIESDRRAVKQTGYQLLVASNYDTLASDKGDLWDSGRVASDENIQIAYAGKPLQPGQDAYWKVRVWTQTGGPSPWSGAALWRVGMLDTANWKAQWIGAPGTVPEGRLPARPSPMLRKGFTLSKPVNRALVSVSALGAYELRINGQRVGDQVLAPEWTDYHKRVQYQTYDVTVLLTAKDNAVGAILGDGWYAGRIGLSHIVPNDPYRGLYGKQLGLLMQLDIEYADGTREQIVSDNTWKATTDGPVVKACLLDGEVYDARKEMPGWDGPGFDDAKWGKVEILPPLKAALVAQHNEPIRLTQDIIPVSLSEPKPGVYVFDFGQNIAGWCRIRMKGKPGEAITLRHAEVLNPDGTLYRTNLRIDDKGYGARAEDQYTPKTDGEEIWEPHFTYHGFRYVEVTGLPARPGLTSILARVQHSTPTPTGAFECSDPMLNKLALNINWTLRDNLPSVPTDCPQRDERCGWMGDMLSFAQTACFEMDMAAFFTKWAQDIRDGQADDGRYPDFAPHPYGPNQRFSGVPAWGDCGVWVPWRMYVNYGDVRVLDAHFESARRWVDWIHKNNPNLLWQKVRNNDYGDWLNGDTLDLEKFGYKKGMSEVPKEVFATAFFEHSTRLVAHMAALTGRKAEAAQYTKLADDIKAAFQKAHIDSDGLVKGNTQAGQALALHFGLMPEALREPAMKHLLERIEAYNGHISTGFHTTQMLMTELSRAGHADVAYKLINNRTIPSWGYVIDKGGTTIWERWDGYVEGRGFQDPGMNSFCHYSIGAVGEWMFRTILGINPDEAQAAFRHFTLRPLPGGGLTFASGSYHSIQGPITSAWRIDGNVLIWVAEIPANTTATLYVPATDVNLVTEGDGPAKQADGLRFVGMEGGAAVFEAGSGTYVFNSRNFRQP